MQHTHESIIMAEMATQIPKQAHHDHDAHMIEDFRKRF
jgi:hypothetical protein